MIKIFGYIYVLCIYIYIYYIYFLFYQDVLHRHWTVGEGRGTIFYSTVSLPPANKHWDIYSQLCKWNDYHLFFIATLVFTRLLLDEIYHLIELKFAWEWWYNVCLLDELILGFCYSDLTLETGRFELVSTITLIL